MIKLINYKNHEKGQIVFINKSCIGGMVRDEQDGLTHVWDNGVTECAAYDFKETPEEILAMPDIEEGIKTIDWEQRRYEIAKEMLPVIYYDDKPQEGEDYLTLNQAAHEAVRYADALITELKKGGEK